MNSSTLSELRAIVGDVRTDDDSLLTYGRDWSRLHTAKPSAIVFPRSAEQVQHLVMLANREKLALVPSAGRTGMSGAALAASGEIVVSFARMNRILRFDRVDASVVCQPGVITQTLQDYAREQGLFYPVDFGARGSSQIGGNIATNAGGIKVIRYGLTRNWISGLKVITGKGDFLELNKGLMKNATGYDLRHLFIGSEGTLGFIVEATVKLTRPPQEPRVMVFAASHRDAMMEIYGQAQKSLQLNAFEFFTEKCLRYVRAHGLNSPFAQPSDYYVLIEFDKTSETAMETALELYEYCAGKGWIEDGIISETESQARELWRLREDITESIARYQPYKNDISVPVAGVADFMAEVDQLLQQEYAAFDVLWFGHVGDGNLHINIIKPEQMEPGEFAARCDAVNQLLFAAIARYKGSISAEHGVGLTKKPYLHFSRDSAEIAYMQALKRVFDPNSIMNPGKIFDPAV